MSRDFVPERFSREVLRHIVGVENLARYPQILSIFGRPGDGKTYQTEVVLRSVQYAPVVSSASAIQGAHEGDAVREFVELYGRACEIRRAGQRSAVVIEDFDTSIASSRTSTSYGVNSQLFVSYLMNLSEGLSAPSDEFRCPIILTGNDFSGVYAPLLRPGRMSFFEWKPTPKELESMVASVLELYGLRQASLPQRIVRTFQDVSIATVRAAIQEALADAMLEQALREGSIKELGARRENVQLDIAGVMISIEKHHTGYMKIISP